MRDLIKDPRDDLFKRSAHSAVTTLDVWRLGEANLESKPSSEATWEPKMHSKWFTKGQVGHQEAKMQN